jgi:tRNA A37 threonylcarbamoyladenosine synthetase subunit TsaC/SUA5/YrdC
MEEILASEAGLLDACLEFFTKFPVIMLQFPEVFALMAPPNQDGVDGLNRVKNRLPEKFYSTLIGDSSNFIGLSNQMPDYLPLDQFEKRFVGALVRIKISALNPNSALCCQGTHQGLLYKPGSYRDLFKSLEKAFSPIADPAFFFGKNYSAVICTSANLSGHPNGSITDLDNARSFAKKAGIPLMIRSDDPGKSIETGSYPVLIPNKSSVIIEREGPGLEEIMRRFPAGMIRRKNQV